MIKALRRSVRNNCMVCIRERKKRDTPKKKWDTWDVAIKSSTYRKKKWDGNWDADLKVGRRFQFASHCPTLH